MESVLLAWSTTGKFVPCIKVCNFSYLSLVTSILWVVFQVIPLKMHLLHEILITVYLACPIKCVKCIRGPTLGLLLKKLAVKWQFQLATEALTFNDTASENKT